MRNLNGRARFWEGEAPAEPHNNSANGSAGASPSRWPIPKITQGHLAILSCLLAAFTGRDSFGGEPARFAERPNVLFIAIDDQNDWMGCLGGHPQVQTPHFDRVASTGTLLTNAHIQSPLCNPSRSSLLTGLRPSTTGIYGLAPGIRDVERTKDHVTLPQTFTEAGYFTYTCGKIYHDGSIKPKDQPREFNEWGPAPGQGGLRSRLPGCPNRVIRRWTGVCFPSGTKTREITRSPPRRSRRSNERRRTSRS